MKILDLDMDYFMTEIASSPESSSERLAEKEYGNCVWAECEVRHFLEKNLGLSKFKKIQGRVVKGHNESLFFWKELIKLGALEYPFEVVHVDSHADLGLGYSSWTYILDMLLSYPVECRPNHNNYIDCFGKMTAEGIGDYLLFAIAYRWISKLVYCANPKGDKDDYLWDVIKDFDEQLIGDEPVTNFIQLLHNPEMEFPNYGDDNETKRRYISDSIKEPEVPFVIIPTVEGVEFEGDFDYVVLAQSPNYTPASADFIIDIFKEYIIEI